MSTSILCAVDLSQAQPENKTLKIAAKLAALDGAQLDVLTVVPDFGISQVSTFFPAGYEDKAVENAKQALVAHCEEVLGAEVNAKVRHEVAIGKVYEEVLRVAEAAGSDLIVIGSHSPSLRDYLLGTNASMVVRHSTCSVYVVR